MTENTLSVEGGIRIQQSQLKAWETILTAEAYERLYKWAVKDNDKAQTGYDITRGDRLSNFIGNLKDGY